MSRRSPKARLTSGDSCFADQSFAFVKVSFLLADMHDDAWLSGSAFVVPQACGSGAGIEARLIWCWVLFATGNNQRREQRACNSQYSSHYSQSGGYYSMGAYSFNSKVAFSRAGGRL